MQCELATAEIVLQSFIPQLSVNEKQFRSQPVALGDRMCVAKDVVSPGVSGEVISSPQTRVELRSVIDRALRQNIPHDMISKLAW